MESTSQEEVLGGTGRKSQCARILRLLIDARGAWVPSFEIAKCALQYSARVLELRRLGFVIENKTEGAHSQRHSWFRLAGSPVAGKKERPAAIEAPK